MCKQAIVLWLLAIYVKGNNLQSLKVAEFLLWRALNIEHTRPEISQQLALGTTDW